MGQEDGLVGRFVGGMIRRTVRARFRNVYWNAPREALKPPVVFVANHNGWHDGYLMFHLVSRLGIRCLDWIEEFGAFPLFRHVGGLPFPPSDPAARAATVKRTIRQMNDECASLVLFAEGTLHRPPEVLALGKSLETVSRKVPSATVLPVAIVYDMSLHERPEAYMRLGDSVNQGLDLAARTRDSLDGLLQGLRADIGSGVPFETLAIGTKDVNERWDMRGRRRD